MLSSIPTTIDHPFTLPQVHPRLSSLTINDRCGSFLAERWPFHDRAHRLHTAYGDGRTGTAGLQRRADLVANAVDRLNQRVVAVTIERLA